LEIIGALERELKIQIPDEALTGLQTVRDLVNAVERRFTV
ncbi:MAG: acyl carrier protein, partial [Proteobacteria bacterium]